MPDPLLCTKLRIPEACTDLVARPQLFERLNAVVRNKLTLVSAPAGSGKTTLVSAWLGTCLQEALKAGWVSIDGSDNDPIRFWRYVIIACQAIDPAIGQAALTHLQTVLQPSWERLLTVLLNELARSPCAGVLVLDDYHLVTTPAIHETLAFLIDHLPSTLHLIIITRNDPPLPLARWRARPDYLELRAPDLRFSSAETAAFMQHAVAEPLAPDQIDRLETRVEGWVTGVCLVALMLRGGSRPVAQALEELLAAPLGRCDHIVAYLTAEVLHAQPADLQEFLLRTSVLGHVTGSLCDAVNGRDDSTRILAHLERANMFLAPLDRAGDWYRYHPLFAEALQHEARQRLGAGAIRDVWRRASRWYADHGRYADAVEAALTAHDWPFAAELIMRSTAPNLVHLEHHLLRRWLTCLPEQVLHAHPPLCMIYAIAILFTSDRRDPATIALLQAPLQIAEQHWRMTRVWHKLGEVLAFRAFVCYGQGELQRAFRFAREATALLPADDIQWRGMSLDVLGVEALLNGALEEAHHRFNESRARWSALGNTYGVLAATLSLAEVCVGQGALCQAQQYYQQVVADTHAACINRRQADRRRATAQLGLATLALEWNDLDAAERYVAEAIAAGQEAHDEEVAARAALLQARVTQVRGRASEAQEAIRQLIAQTTDLRLLRKVYQHQARLALACGDLRTAERAIAAAQQGEALMRGAHEQVALLLARLRIAQGATTAALDLLGRWRGEAGAAGRTHSMLQMIVLQSLAYAAQNDLLQARATLLQALVVAQAEGYRRLFLDEGAAIVNLLGAIAAELPAGPLAMYVQTLLRDFAHERSASADLLAATLPHLIEPLSPQERRVLQLIVAGHSNAEIARVLVVSINTVKTQIRSIYRKLSVNSRHEARAAARLLVFD